MQGANLLQAVPDNAICCGLVVSLSVTDRVPLNEPTPEGANFTEMSHEVPDARFVVRAPWHGVVIENGPAAVPVMAWPVMFNTEPPVFVIVSDRVFVGYGPPRIFRPPKSKLEGISFTVPAVRVIVTPACLVLSATDVAVMVTVDLVGTAGGAANTVALPLAVIA